MIKEVTVYIALSFDNTTLRHCRYSSLGPETRRDILSQHPLRDDPGLDLATRQIQIDMLDSHWRTAFCIRPVVLFPARFPLARDRFPSLLRTRQVFPIMLEAIDALRPNSSFEHLCMTSYGCWHGALGQGSQPQRSWIVG